MAAKKAKKHPRGAPPRGARKSGEDFASLIATALASHESSIAQLAEVVVNLHANVRALRDLVEALAEPRPRVAGAKRRLRRIKLDE
jgi:phage shock protein A